MSTSAPTRRAAEALCTADTSYWHHEQTDDYPCSSCVEKAQTAATAALRDSDDPDALPREYVARLARESRKTRCARVCWHAKWDDLAEPDRDVIRAQIDAMTAAVLGGA